MTPLWKYFYCCLRPKLNRKHFLFIINKAKKYYSPPSPWNSWLNIFWSEKALKSNFSWFLLFNSSRCCKSQTRISKKLRKLAPQKTPNVPPERRIKDFVNVLFDGRQKFASFYQLVSIQCLTHFFQLKHKNVWLYLELKFSNPFMLY